MNWPFHSLVSKILNRPVSSWDRAPAGGHSEALREIACRAPHAPRELQSHFVFGELRVEIRRTTSDHDALKRLQLRTSGGKNSAVKAAHKVSNSPDRTATEHAHKNQAPGRMWSDRVGEVKCATSIQRMLGIVECLRQTVSQYEIPAQLRFQSSANDPLYRRTRATTSQAIQHTIVLQRLVEPSNLPSAAAETLRLFGTGYRNNPTKALN